MPYMGRHILSSQTVTIAATPPYTTPLCGPRKIFHLGSRGGRHKPQVESAPMWTGGMGQERQRRGSEARERRPLKLRHRFVFERVYRYSGLRRTHVAPDRSSLPPPPSSSSSPLRPSPRPTPPLRRAHPSTSKPPALPSTAASCGSSAHPPVPGHRPPLRPQRVFRLSVLPHPRAIGPCGGSQSHPPNVHVSQQPSRRAARHSAATTSGPPAGHARYAYRPHPHVADATTAAATAAAASTATAADGSAAQSSGSGSGSGERDSATGASIVFRIAVFPSRTRRLPSNPTPSYDLIPLSSQNPMRLSISAGRVCKATLHRFLHRLNLYSGIYSRPSDYVIMLGCLASAVRFN